MLRGILIHEVSPIFLGVIDIVLGYLNPNNQVVAHILGIYLRSRDVSNLVGHRKL